jgi:uncharacterized protein
VRAPFLALAALALLVAGCGGAPDAAPAAKSGEAAAGTGQGAGYPRLTGRIVDNANLLTPAQEAELARKLEALERASSRQLVILTAPDLGGRSIDEYGVGLGRAWRLGQAGANNGAVLIVAVAEKKVRIEVGYGLEGILTDALASQIIRDRITPRFRADDYPGGINAGADAIIEQLRAPPEAAEARAAAAARSANEGRSRRGGESSPLGLLIWGGLLLFFLVPLALGRLLLGRRRSGPWGRGGRVSTWGPGGGGSGLGWMLAGAVLGNLTGRGGGGGGGWGGGSGGGGFTGGGGSFGGGGASGGW